MRQLLTLARCRQADTAECPGVDAAVGRIRPKSDVRWGSKVALMYRKAALGEAAHTSL